MATVIRDSFFKRKKHRYIAKAMGWEYPSTAIGIVGQIWAASQDREDLTCTIDDLDVWIEERIDLEKLIAALIDPKVGVLKPVDGSPGLFKIVGNEEEIEKIRGFKERSEKANKAKKEKAAKRGELPPPEHTPPEQQGDLSGDLEGDPQGTDKETSLDPLSFPSLSNNKYINNGEADFCGNVENPPDPKHQILKSLFDSIPVGENRLVPVFACVSLDTQRSWLSQFTAAEIVSEAIACVNHHCGDAGVPVHQFTDWARKINTFLANFKNRSNVKVLNFGKGKKTADDPYLVASNFATDIWKLVAAGAGYDTAKRTLDPWAWWFVEHKFGKWRGILDSVQRGGLTESAAHAKWRDVMLQSILAEKKGQEA